MPVQDFTRPKKQYRAWSGRLDNEIYVINITLQIVSARQRSCGKVMFSVGHVRQPVILSHTAYSPSPSPDAL